MAKFTELFKASSRELRSVKCLTLTAMLGAVSIVLGSLVVTIGDFLKVGFNFLPNNFVFYLFGPVVGVIYGLSADILTFIVRPTGPYFFGFTLSAMVTGLLYGILLYKRPLSMRRIIAANLVHLFVVNLFMNTYWLTLLYGYQFMALLPVRALKAFLLLPLETVMLYLVIKGVEASGVIHKLHLGERTKISNK
ncbi:ECF transporter S component (folate family) [Anaerotaenia torta]|uniref:folate family ECF transporter S component n=1 Tax=Anaerotaenia torta TaxID=433293 RepID=UPI003D21D3DE